MLNKSINFKPRDSSQAASRSTEYRSRPVTAYIKDNNTVYNQRLNQNNNNYSKYLNKS